MTATHGQHRNHLQKPISRLQLGGSGVPFITVGVEEMMDFDANLFVALWENTRGKQGLRSNRGPLTRFRMRAVGLPHAPILGFHMAITAPVGSLITLNQP
jgi:hypothetical protein